MTLTAQEVVNRYPLHWLVWNNKHEDLRNALQSEELSREEKERKDPRGRTPLLLAVTLGHIESTKVLLSFNCDLNCEKDGWTAVHEATASGNSELLSLVLSRRDFQRQMVRAFGIPDLLNKLSMAPDFYVEMKWEFTSWVPLVSRLCPFDTYKVYKRGANVRVDTTLVGFENNRWQRGDRTYLFKGVDGGASLVELDHETCTSITDTLGGVSVSTPPSARALRQRFSTPVTINYLDTEKISFERTKGGIWGWRQDKMEMVNGYECKVWSANNVELVSRTRSEHVPPGARFIRQLLPGLLALADDASPPDTPDTPHSTEPSTPGSPDPGTPGSPPSPAQEEPPPTSKSQEDLSKFLTWELYFSDEPLNDKDIGRPREMTTKIQKFKATLWLCENYPLELQEQLMPLLNLMASISSPHFGKLKDFIQMQLPSGFPVKIEIPLFHVLNARITFGNIFACDSPVTHVECISEGDRLACVIDDAVFSIGSHYRRADEMHHSCDRDDDGLLEYAIQQSLMEAGTHEDQVDVWEALRGARPGSPRRAPPSPPALAAYDLEAYEERQLQRAIAASLAGAQEGRAEQGSPVEGPEGEEGDEPLAAALLLSAQEQRERQERLRLEREQLQRAVWLSMQDSAPPQ